VSRADWDRRVSGPTGADRERVDMRGSGGRYLTIIPLHGLLDTGGGMGVFFEKRGSKFRSNWLLQTGRFLSRAWVFDDLEKMEERSLRY